VAQLVRKGTIRGGIEVSESSGLVDYMHSSEEPAVSKVILTLGVVISFLMLMLYSILYPGHPLPVLGQVVPFFAGVADSSIWFFLLGIMAGAFLLLAAALVEVAND
jgi:hypothetical protein